MFLGYNSKSKRNKSKNKQVGHIKLERFCTAKKNYQQNKIWENFLMKWEKAFVNNIFDKGFNIKMSKELNNSIAKYNPIKN